jgi:hypothetical protein
MKQTLMIAMSVLAMGASVAKADVLNDSILKTTTGSVSYLSFKQAAVACPAGKHLPTIREIAQASVQRGAGGLLEVNQVNPDQTPAGYRLVSAANLDGTKDDFYFNAGRFEALDGEVGNTFVWSSSIDRGDNRKAYTLLGGNADVESYFQGNTFAVACFPTN